MRQDYCRDANPVRDDATSRRAPAAALFRHVAAAREVLARRIESRRFQMLDLSRGLEPFGDCLEAGDRADHGALFGVQPDPGDERAVDLERAERKLPGRRRAEDPVPLSSIEGRNPCPAPFSRISRLPSKSVRLWRFGDLQRLVVDAQAVPARG